MADCTIRIIAGPDAGKEFTCAGAQTVLGRAAHCAVPLEGPGISFEHALIAREGNSFFVENLSANGTLLNRERVAARTRLRIKDQLQFGPETVVRVERLPAAGGGGGGSRLWLVGVVAMVAILGIEFIALDPFSDADSVNWLQAYNTLKPFVQNQADAGSLPREVPALLEQAWRLRIAGSDTDAQDAWLKLHVLLDSVPEWQGQGNLERLSLQYPSALAGLTRQGGAAPEEPPEMLAGLVQLATHMEHAK